MHEPFLVTCAQLTRAPRARPPSYSGKQYRPTGPALLSATDMAETLSRVLRRKVRRVDLPWRMFLKAARIGNVGDFLVSGLRYYVEDHKQGAFALGAPTNDVLEVTGRPAEDFETTTRCYAARRPARRNFANWLRTFFDFMSTPIMPGYNPERLDRELRFPVPPVPLRAMANERWKAEHGARFAGSSPTGAMEHSLMGRRGARQTWMRDSA